MLNCRTSRCLAILLTGCLSWQLLAQGTPRHGDVRMFNDNHLAWHNQQQQWMPLESFWLQYAQHNGGHFWGAKEVYPEYDKVQENDTLLIQTESGPCLMEFFHQRWRRANDVRRWDKAFNEYGGCSTVFDD